MGVEHFIGWFASLISYQQVLFLALEILVFQIYLTLTIICTSRAIAGVWLCQVWINVPLILLMRHSHQLLGYGDIFSEAIIAFLIRRWLLAHSTRMLAFMLLDLSRQLSVMSPGSDISSEHDLIGEFSVVLILIGLACTKLSLFIKQILSLTKAINWDSKSVSRCLVLVKHRWFTVALGIEVKIFALLKRVDVGLWHEVLLWDNLSKIWLLIVVKLTFAVLLVSLLLSCVRINIHALDLVAMFLIGVWSSTILLPLRLPWRLFDVLDFIIHIRSKFAHVELYDFMTDLFVFLLRLMFW